MAEIAAVILTGGRSSRMGTDKARVALAGRTMGEWVSRAIGAAIPDGVTMVLGATGVSDLPRFDDGPGRGPLSGLAGVPAATATLGIEPDGIVVLAVDHPWVRAGTIAAMCERFTDRSVVPLDGATRQVTCAIYSMQFVVAAATAAVSGWGFQRVLDDTAFDAVPETTWRRWGEDGRSWFSVDRPEDITLGLERFGVPGR